MNTYYILRYTCARNVGRVKALCKALETGVSRVLPTLTSKGKRKNNFTLSFISVWHSDTTKGHMFRSSRLKERSVFNETTSRCLICSVKNTDEL
jgi:hypothetical protein